MSEQQRAPVPARMVNEWVYCPRLAVLEWAHGEWDASADTVDGARVHARVDRPTGPLPEPPDEAGDGAAEGEGEPDELVQRARSVWLTAEEEGLTAKMDVVDVDGGQAVPVDTKRGRPPEDGAWEADRVQLCAQGLVLREHGWRCERGYVWYAATRRRVEVIFDEALVARTRAAVHDLRAAAEAGALPAPLADSPKCPRCSLVGICLPDEVRWLAEERASQSKEEPRQLLAPRADGLPLYVNEQGATIGLSQGELVVTRSKAELARVRLRDVTQVGLFGAVQVTTPALRALMDAGVAVCFFSYGGWFVGTASGHHHKNVLLRAAQFRAAADPVASLAVARELVAGKIRNQRTLLRRNHPDPGRLVLRELARLAGSARHAPSQQTLLGVEGAAAHLYFQSFGGLLKAAAFDFGSRNRRPPRDPVNALLSYAYSLLVKDCHVAAASVGLDPYLGLYHQPRYGKPALALDLMEELRPIVADSVVISALNTGEVAPGHFVTRADGCALTADGRKAFLRAWERRMDTLITHPMFGYRASWRRTVEVQARLLGRHLMGETPRYVPIETR